MDWIEHAITAILIGAFMAYASSQSTKELSKNIEGKYCLRLNVSYKWIGMVSIVLGIVAFIAGLLSDEEGIFMIVFFVLLIFGGLGIILVMWYQNHQLIFDEETISVKSWKGKTETVKWEAIDNIKFSPIMGYLRIYSKTKKLNIHFHLVGLVGFVRMMEEKTKYTARELKLPFKID